MEGFYKVLAILLLMKFDYIELGATLFVPATHKDLEAVVNTSKYPSLKSVVIDTEDGINQSSLQDALEIIRELLKSLKKSSSLLFIRPKNVDVLKELLEYEDIEKIDGFILPKFSLENADSYLDLLKNRAFAIMPSVEGEELFSHIKLYELCETLLPYKDKIVLIRFGLEDMLRQLKMRRKCSETIFDFSTTSAVLGDFIATFKGAGFAVSGGVYPCFKDSSNFKKDVQRDLREGLFSKTIVHPKQIDIVHEQYKVTKKEFDEALEIYFNEEAVFSQNSKMSEVVTMVPWAKEIIKRAQVYGIHSYPY